MVDLILVESNSSQQKAFCYAALNMFTVLLAKELKGTCIKVNSADPGLTQTDMGGEDATDTIEEGTKPAVWPGLFGRTRCYRWLFSHQKVNPWQFAK